MLKMMKSWLKKNFGTPPWAPLGSDRGTPHRSVKRNLPPPTLRPISITEGTPPGAPPGQNTQKKYGKTWLIKKL